MISTLPRPLRQAIQLLKKIPLYELQAAVDRRDEEHLQGMLGALSHCLSDIELNLLPLDSLI